MTIKFNARTLLTGIASKLQLQWVTGDKTLTLVDADNVSSKVVRVFKGKTTAPGIGDDSADGYIIGDVWVDETADKVYCVTDVTVGVAVWKDLTGAAGGGEANTASNIGVGGVGVFKQKTGVNLEFKKINSGTGLSITDDTANNEVDVAISDVELLALAGLVSAADQLAYFTGSGTASLTTLTSFIRTLLDDIDAATARATLGVVIGTDVQAFDADLSVLAGLIATTDNFIVSVASAWASRTPAQVRTTLALVIGTNVQAWDADLDTWATKVAPSGVVLGTTDTQTLTNKRISARLTSEASNAAPSINSDNVDNHRLTAMAVAITSITITGTPTHGQEIVLEFLDNGTARAITHGAPFRSGTTATLLTTTVVNKLSKEKFMWDSVDSKWDCMAVWTEA